MGSISLGMSVNLVCCWFLAICIFSVFAIWRIFYLYIFICKHNRYSKQLCLVCFHSFFEAVSYLFTSRGLISVLHTKKRITLSWSGTLVYLVNPFFCVPRSQWALPISHGFWNLESFDIQMVFWCFCIEVLIFIYVIELLFFQIEFSLTSENIFEEPVWEKEGRWLPWLKWNTGSY